jgi:exopolyphosphatase/guanosine-5'-triphosphate,3'-diphosphate pyrophosphatase
MREASNRNDLLKVLEKEISPDVSVISGNEEARLIYLGVSSGVHIDTKKCIFIDIGGGSTEIILGDQTDYYFLDSVKLGAIRVSTLFPGSDPEGRISRDTYNEMKEYSKKKLVKTLRELEKYKWKYIFGSSGTIQNLAEISSKMNGSKNKMGGMVLSLVNLKKVSKTLRKMSLEERKGAPGINPNRADIIIGGAAVLESTMETLGIREIISSKRGLRHGLMIEVLQRKGLYPKGEISVKDRSIIHLASECNFDEKHSMKVRDLALQLFDSSKKAGLHDLTDDDREFMGYSAILHDIGNLISFRKHHHHSYYIIMNSELLGFNMKEIAILANITRYHRKSSPSDKDLKTEGLDERSRYKVRVMAMLLRLSENLDRAHRGLIRKAEFKNMENGRAVLGIEAEENCHLEKWGLNSNRELFRDIFGHDLEARFSTTP